jgi:hypothetical protein
MKERSWVRLSNQERQELRRLLQSVGLSRPMGVGSDPRIAATMLAGVFPLKAALPVTIS